MGIKSLVNSVYLDRFYGVKVQRTAAPDPNGGATQDLFLVAGGVVLMTMFIGLRTVIQAAAASNFTLSHEATAMSAATAVTNNAVGTTYTITGNFADAIQIAAAGTAAMAGITEGLLATGIRCRGILLPAGHLEMTGSGVGATGSCTYYVYYIPIDAAATMVAA